MSGTTNPLRDELRTEREQLDNACRHHLGVSAAVFRTAKFVFYIVTLAFTGYLIEVASVEPVLAMSFAALLITGPEGVEALLVRNGVIQENTGEDDA